MTFQEWVKVSGGTAKVAKKLGVSEQAVKMWKWRRGWPKVETILEIIRISPLTFEEIIKSTRLKNK